MNTGVATTPTAERGLSVSNEIFWIVYAMFDFSGDQSLKLEV